MEDPTEGGTTFRLVYMQKNRPKWLPGCQVEEETKKICRPLLAERPAAAMFVHFLPSTRIFRAKIVRKIVSLGRS